MWNIYWNATSEKLWPHFVTTLGCTLPVCLDFVRSLVQWFLGPPALSQKFHFLFFWLLLGFTSLTRFKRKDQDHRLNSMGQARVNVDFEPRFVPIFWHYSVTFYCLYFLVWISFKQKVQDSSMGQALDFKIKICFKFLTLSFHFLKSRKSKSKYLKNHFLFE